MYLEVNFPKQLRAKELFVDNWNSLSALLSYQ